MPEHCRFRCLNDYQYSGPVFLTLSWIQYQIYLKHHQNYVGNDLGLHVAEDACRSMYTHLFSYADADVRVYVRICTCTCVHAFGACARICMQLHESLYHYVRCSL